MLIAILVLSVALILCTQMVCATWRDTTSERCQTMLELKEPHDLYRH